MGKTISEKILSAHCRENLRAGEIGIADVDFAYGHDGTGPLAYKAFSEVGGDHVFDGTRIALVIDHTVPSCNEEGKLPEAYESFCIEIRYISL